MATYKEIANLKNELLAIRQDKIKRSLNYQQQNLYQSLISDFVKVAKDKVNGKGVSLFKLQQELKKQYSLTFPDVMTETVKASSSIIDLNHRYFSTLLETNKLLDLKDKTASVINKSLGLTDNGKLKVGGFIDKTLDNKKVQRIFTKEVQTILSGNPDTVLMQKKLKEFIIGTDQSTGILERYYRTFAKDLLSNIDRTGSLVYADELELNHFFYSGALKTTSRSFCIKKEGKIFTRKEAEKWKDSTFITEMYGANINDYVPLINMGGYGCEHRPDWITSDIAKKLKGK